MTSWLRFSVRCAVVVALVLGCCGFHLAQAAEADKAAAPASPAIAKLQEAKGDFSITVLPIVLPNQPIELLARVDFAKGLANVLERTGMKSIEVSPDEFSVGSAAPGDLEAFAKAVTAYLKQHPVQTDYVYAMEYYGKQEEVATAILTVLADNKGQILWKNRQGPSDPTFQQYQPNSLLVAELVSVEPFRRMLNLGDPTAKEVYKGRWNEFFENKRKQHVPKKASHEPGKPNYAAIGITGTVLIVVAVVITVQRSKHKGP